MISRKKENTKWGCNVWNKGRHRYIKSTGLTKSYITDL